MKKLLTNFLFAVLLVMLAPVSIHTVDVKAAVNDQTIAYCEEFVVNPLYEDVISIEDLKADLKALEKESAGRYSLEAADSTTPLTDHDDMAEILREGLKNHETTVTYTVFEPDRSFLGSDNKFTTAWKNEHIGGIFEIAVSHTGVPDEGDYMLWQYGAYQASLGASGSSTSGYEITVTFTISYYATAAEEAQVSGKVATILSGLNLAPDASAYEKVQAIYDYLCENVTYDYPHLNDENYTKQYTAYGALIDGTSVCQGYAVAFYRLALELGVDSRVITGTSHSENHAWNIAKIGAYYYNLDATWDASYTPATYQYFLKANANFADHTRNADYTSAAFDSAYPMTTASFVACGNTHTAGQPQITKEADCLNDGMKITECTNCGKVMSTAVVQALGHAYGETVTREATCTVVGEKEFKCTRCADTYTKDIPMKEHTIVVDEAVTVTCTTDGKTEGKHCSVCGLVTEAQTVIPSKGHTIVTDEAVAVTCTTDGKTEGKHCSVCNLVTVEQTVIPALGHAYGETVTREATCTDAGEKEFRCTRCGDNYTSEIPSKGHTIVVDEAVAVTCTTDGKTEGKHCSVCGQVTVSQNTIPAPGHTIVVDQAVTATCTTDGKTEGKHCSVCSEVIVKQDTIQALGHMYNETVIREATCAVAGEKECECTRCYDKTTVEIPKTEHVIVDDPKVEPTCTDSGMSEGKHCQTCGQVTVEPTEIPALGHSYKDIAVTREATCTEKGEKECKCTICDDEITVEIPSKGHTIVTDPLVDPTCTAPGKTEGKHCSVCNLVTAAQTAIPALGHSKEENVIPATPTANGKITTTCSICDAVLAPEQIIYKASKVSLAKGSYTFDGKVKTPAIYVRDENGKDIAGTYYTVTKSAGRKNVGLYAYTVRFKGNYSGTVKKTFIINPKGTTLNTPAAAKKAFTAKWAKQSAKMASSRITGYQIRYSLKSSMASSKTKTVAGYSKTSLKIGSLKSGKKYYMQVRTYMTVSGTKYYSAWSTKKSVKVK